MAVSTRPEGYHSITPYLIVDDASAAIDFYQRAFGAEEVYRLPMTDAAGNPRVGHAEVRIGDSVMMLSDEWPHMDALGPKSRGGPTSTFLVYVPDVDAAFQRALDAGGHPHTQVEDQFWGDRSGTIADPFGHHWMLATHVEDVPPEELPSRMAAWAARHS